jgi:Flp pilus assembly protein TadG
LRPCNCNHDEQGIIIVLVAVFMLGAVGAMAALSIDVVTLYTARSEAQLAADAGALAAARALANSGATSDATGALMALAEPIASNVAIQVAQSSMVGGRKLVAANGEVVVSFSDSTKTPCLALKPVTNPCVTVSVQRADLPTFFARIWGSTQIKVAASATAEAYNPTPAPGSTSNPNPPVAPDCVKPWLLPNIDPRPGVPVGTTIFDPAGTIKDANLLGWNASTMASRLRARSITMAPVAWRYYAGNPISFPAPTQARPNCTTPLTTPYEWSVAGCVQTAIACNSTTVQIDDSAAYTTAIRNSETADAVNCLTNSSTGAGGDTVLSTNPPTVPFEFVAGANNPIPGASGNDVTVSNSLVTVPVYDVVSPSLPPPLPPNTVTIVGFVQLFVNADGLPAANNPGATNGRVNTTVVNLVGCGTSSTGTPVLGNGASAVAVRLISP